VKKPRTGKPGSIRGEAARRGVTEALIRKERALARGLTNTQGRGHKGKGVALLSNELAVRSGKFKTWERYDEDGQPTERWEQFTSDMSRAARQRGIPLRAFWTMILSG
jgi:hypothetical protein